MNETPYPLIHLGNSLLYRVVQPLLLSSLITCFLIGPITVARQAFPERNLGAMGWFVFGVALQSTLTTLWLYHPDRRIVGRWQYRVAEVMLLLVGARLVSWVSAGTFPPTNHWPLYLLNPLSLFDGLFIWYSFLALLAWERAMRLSLIFCQLAIGIEEARYYQQARAVRLADHDSNYNRQREQWVKQFFQEWLIMGIVLGICAALTTFQVEELLVRFRNLSRLGLPSVMLSALVGYFLIGFWLLSQARFAYLYGRWLRSEIIIPSVLWRNWNQVSLIFLLLLATVAAFLPIGSTIGVAYILQIIVGVIVATLTGIFALFAIIFSFLLTLLTGSRSVWANQQRENPFQPPFTEPPIAFRLPNEETAFFLGGAFWIVVLIVVVMGIIFFLNERRRGWKMPALSQLWHTFWHWLIIFWQDLCRQATDLRQWIQPSAPSDSSLDQQPPPLSIPAIRPNRLSPRQQIFYFYLSILHRAQQKGINRSPSTTPLEFLPSLQANTPQAEKDVQALTESFLQARYNHRPIVVEEVIQVKKLWQRVRSHLRRPSQT